jgi:hypothetical protein
MSETVKMSIIRGAMGMMSINAATENFSMTLLIVIDITQKYKNIIIIKV